MCSAETRSTGREHGRGSDGVVFWAHGRERRGGIRRCTTGLSRGAEGDARAGREEAAASWVRRRQRMGAGVVVIRSGLGDAVTVMVIEDWASQLLAAERMEAGLTVICNGMR